MILKTPGSSVLPLSSILSCSPLGGVGGLGWRWEQTHSVSKWPGRIALTRILGPWDIASHFIRCRPFIFFKKNFFGHWSATLITRRTIVFSVWVLGGGRGGGEPHLRLWTPNKPWYFLAWRLRRWKTLLEKLHRLDSRWMLVRLCGGDGDGIWYWWPSTVSRVIFFFHSFFFSRRACFLLYSYRIGSPGRKWGEGRGVMRTLSHSSSVKASRSTLEVNLVHP